MRRTARTHWIGTLALAAVVALAAPFAQAKGGSLLSNGATVVNLSAGAGTGHYFSFHVPPGAAQLEIDTWGGTGDCDLYVSHGSQPTPRSYQFRSAAPANTESLRVMNPAAGWWHVLAHAETSYSWLSLRARHSGNAYPPSGPPTVGSGFQPPPPPPAIVLNLTGPTGRSVWRAGDVNWITWRASGAIRYVQLQFSADDGRTWHGANFPSRIPAATGRFLWQVPLDNGNYATSTARIRILGIGSNGWGSGVSATSDRFQIQPGRTAPPHHPYLRPPVRPTPRPPRHHGHGLPHGNIRLGETQTRVLREDDEDEIVCPTAGPGQYIVHFSNVTREIEGEIRVHRGGRDDDEKEVRDFEFRGQRVYVVNVPVGSRYIKVNVEPEDDDKTCVYSIRILKR